jgi:hypothetical protein
MTAEAATPVRQMDIEAARRRRARMAEEQRLNKMTRVLVTPEGAQLHLKLATAAERAGAFAMDVAIQWAIVIGTLLGLGFGAASMGIENVNIAFRLLAGLLFLRPQLLLHLLRDRPEGRHARQAGPGPPGRFPRWRTADGQCGAGPELHARSRGRPANPVPADGR